MSYGRRSSRSTVHLFTPLKVLDNRVRKYKQCSFSRGMEKHCTLYFPISHSKVHSLHIILSDYDFTNNNIYIFH